MSDYVVYKHTNKINGKIYIGITCQKPEHRWGQDGSGYKECPHFWKAIQKYGWQNFSHEIIAHGLSHQEACEMEIQQIAQYGSNNCRNGYNIHKGGDGFDSEFSRRLWQDESFRNYASSRMREAWQDPEKRERRSAQTKARWANPEFRSQITSKIKKTCAQPVVCVETGVIYETMKDASLATGANKPNICRAIRTGYKCAGYHWKYKDDIL